MTTISITDFIQISANNFANGDYTLAGLVIFSLVVLAIFILTKRIFVGFVCMIPLTLIFSYVGAIPSTMMVILIVVSVIGLAISSRKAVGDDL